MPEIDLDNPRSYSQLDMQDMLRRIDDLPRQMEEAWKLAGEMWIPDEYRSASAVVIAGMGGSAIGGSLLESYGGQDIPVPVHVWRSYGMPGFVGKNTLVIAVSYSGNTEETLSALQTARERGARLMVISTGGEVSALAEQWKVPLLTFEYEAQPRATIGFLFTPLIRIFERLGFLTPQEEAYQEALQCARECIQTWSAGQPTSSNDAKRTAQQCRGRGVVIYGAEYLTSVARRWKTQMNENGENWSFFEEFSELNHNAVVGYRYPPQMAQAMEVVILQAAGLSDRIRLRIKVTCDLMDQYNVPHTFADARGTGRLAEMFSLIALGDYVSYYLALLNGANPSAIEPIDFLKEALARQA